MKPPPYEHIKNQVAFVVIRAYAAHAYIYYTLNDNIITDHEYDALWKFIQENYDWIKPFDLNNYLPPKNQQRSSCFEGVDRICGQTRDYAIDLLKEHKRKIKEATEATAKPIQKPKLKPKPTREVIDEDFDLIG